MLTNNDTGSDNIENNDSDGLEMEGIAYGNFSDPATPGIDWSKFVSDQSPQILRLTLVFA